MASALRRLHAAAGSRAVFSPAEEQLNRRRRAAGLLVAPVVFAALLVAPLPLDRSAHYLSAIFALMVVLWVTEAVPLAVTALIGPVLTIVLRIAPAKTVFAPFADPIIFLFIGSFILAEAMFVHGLDRRVAYGALSSRIVGSSPVRILFVYGGVAALISMWISNTATTAMMFPIGLSIVAHMTEGQESEPGSRDFAMAMMLIAAFGASVGGMGTPVGTPPNLIGIGMLDKLSGVEISFFKWMLLGVPIVVAVFTFLVGWFYFRTLRGLNLRQDRSDRIEEELHRLGPMSAGQRNVIVAFGVTVMLWLIPGFVAIFGAGETAFARAYNAAVPESVAAMTGALLLFVLPVSWRARQFTLSWDEAVKIDWGIILLFGGGLAMGELAFSTGLASSLGHGISAWLPARTPFALTTLFTAVAIVMSEAASNTASANMIVPVAIAVAQAAGVNPVEPALGATLGASMGFMMPISTPPNAIVYSSGHVPITSMIKNGVALDIFGFVVIVALVTGLGWMF
jgi:sodium-dependent dicarboxylate transporter 2/3/5